MLNVRIIVVNIFCGLVLIQAGCSEDAGGLGLFNNYVDSENNFTDSESGIDSRVDSEVINDTDSNDDSGNDSSQIVDSDSQLDIDSETEKDTTGEVIVINPSIHNTILGRPTNNSIAVSVLADNSKDSIYVEYATKLSSDGLALEGVVSESEVVVSKSGEPMVVDIISLKPDTKYYYRVYYNSVNGDNEPGNIHSFRTQRAAGSTFSFGVQGDTHPERYNDKMFHAELFTLTMNQVRDRQPDLYFMLGDDFSIEKIVQGFKEDNFAIDHLFYKGVEGAVGYADYQSSIDYPFLQPMIVDGVDAPAGWAPYKYLRESFLGTMANATSLFLVNGNHELAHSANLGGLFNNSAIWAADGRLKYYPLPAPDSFYSGNETPLTSVNGYPTLEAKDGLLRDYYAFTWGDALFVTIDPYWHSDLVAPDSILFNGDTEEDSWAATMGDEQYEWLQDTLENSTAKWKFVFAHHINGDGRGGAANVGVQEWGAKLAFFNELRPTWEKPVHQLLVDTGVTIFFQGHDHVFARERVDGVIYQSMPNPADNSYFAYNCTGVDPDTISWKGDENYGKYEPDYGVVMPNGGYVHVTVSPEKVGVEYIRTYREVDLLSDPNNIFTGSEVNGEVAFKYSIPEQPDDDLAENFQYNCIGDAPPKGWIYNP